MIGNTKALWLAGALAMALPLSAWAAGGMGDNNGGAMGGMHSRHGMHDCNNRHERMDRMEHKLGLSDAQKRQVKELHEEARKEMRPLFRRKHENMRRMWKLDPDDRGYMAEVKRLAEKQGNLTEELIVDMARSRAKFYSILTDAQKAKLKEMRQEHRGMRHHHRMGGGM